jgi:competence protein ComEA
VFRRLQTIFKEYFSFTKRERRGILVLLAILLLVIIAPYLWNKFFPPKIKPLSEFEQQVTFLKNNTADEKGADSTSYKTKYYNSKETFTIEINSADSTSFERINGIKKFIAARIIKYRKALGGFYSISQLKEVYGLKPQVIDSNMQHFTVDASSIKTININTADNNTLKHHPYIGYSLANVIVQYRTQHGNFNSKADLKKIAIITDDVYEKLAPYITVQ